MSTTDAKPEVSTTGAPDEGGNPGAGKKQQGYKRSKKGCLNCKFRKVKCDEITPTCTACQRLGMPCGNYGTTLSKAAYATQKLAFLEQVRRKGISVDARNKRQKKSHQPTPEQLAREEQMQMQMQLGMASIDDLHGADNVSVLHPILPEHPFGQTIPQDDFYTQTQRYDTSISNLSNETSNNLFEMNPRAGVDTFEQIRQLQLATRDSNDTDTTHALRRDEAFPGNQAHSYAINQALELSPKNEPYVPSMITLDTLINQEQHALRLEEQRAAEEAAVRARKEETLNQQRRLQQQAARESFAG